MNHASTSQVSSTSIEVGNMSYRSGLHLDLNAVERRCQRALVTYYRNEQAFLAQDGPSSVFQLQLLNRQEIVASGEGLPRAGLSRTFKKT
jgi:hypothetical protein